MVPMLIAIVIAAPVALTMNAEDQDRYRAEQQKPGGQACKERAVERSDRMPLLSEDGRYAAERREFDICMAERKS